MKYIVLESILTPEEAMVTAKRVFNQIPFRSFPDQAGTLINKLGH